MDGQWGTFYFPGLCFQRPLYECSSLSQNKTKNQSGEKQRGRKVTWLTHSTILKYMFLTLNRYQLLFLPFKYFLSLLSSSCPLLSLPTLLDNCESLLLLLFASFLSVCFTQHCTTSQAILQVFSSQILFDPTLPFKTLWWLTSAQLDPSPGPRDLSSPHPPTCICTPLGISMAPPGLAVSAAVPCLGLSVPRSWETF